MKKNGLVDDIGGGGDEQTVDRMRGTKTGPGEYTGTVARILANGGFQVKCLVRSGSTDPEELDALGPKFLGMNYDVPADKIVFKVVPLIRLKVKRSRQRRADAVPITEELLEDIRAGLHSLTRRRCLGYVQSQFDPTGNMAPVMLYGKLMLRELYTAGCNLKWDDPLPKLNQEKWFDFIKAGLDMEGIRLSRSLVAEDAKEFWLVAFFDGSMEAYATCVYLRVRCIDAWGRERIETGLVLAKSRVAPLSGSSIPRLELQALVQCTRTVLRLTSYLEIPIHHLTIAGDSMCALQAAGREGISFRPFFQNRVSEVNSNLKEIAKVVTHVEPLMKIEGKANPADLVTRGRASLQDIGPQSQW